MAEAGYVVLTLEYHRVGNRWTVQCKELGTATSGRTLKDAEEKINEAVLLHLNTLEDVGERERFFKENNIQLHRTRPRKVWYTPTGNQVFIQQHIQRLPELVTT